ncbi:hypothetical protein [Streptomyces sp. NPDC054787]
MWSIRQELPPPKDGDRRLFRRAGYDTQTEAQADLDKVRALLNIADKDGRARIGDLLATVGATKEAISTPCRRFGGSPDPRRSSTSGRRSGPPWCGPKSA